MPNVVCVGAQWEARRQLSGLGPARADVIVAGLIIVEGALGQTAVNLLSVSGRGVRHGIVLRLLEV